MPRQFARPINRIVLHTTATSLYAKVEDILEFWRTPKGPKGSKYIPGVQGGAGFGNRPGYTYLIDAYGKRSILSHLDNYTYGVKGFNWDSCHIATIGGKGGIDDRTDAQKEQLVDLINELRTDAILGPVPIVGHRDLSPDLNGDGIITPNEFIKLCPGYDVKEWLKSVNIK